MVLNVILFIVELDWVGKEISFSILEFLYLLESIGVFYFIYGCNF